MYRFLDKKFYFRKMLNYPLREFAREKIGLSRNYDIAQLKRKLLAGIKELEEAGFIERLPIAKRFVRVSQGNWRVVFEQCEAKPQASNSNAVVALLVARGVSKHTARKLLRDRLLDCRCSLNALTVASLKPTLPVNPKIPIGLRGGD